MTESNHGKKRSRPPDNDRHHGHCRSNGKALRVVIVEPHHHALEHIHQALRQQRRLGESWSLCHIDAHPDLACPSNGIPAAACFRPRQEWHALPSSSSSSPPVLQEKIDGTMTMTTSPKRGCLYELLDWSTTGMAEWILPLVLAAGLTRMEWVKPVVDIVTATTTTASCARDDYDGKKKSFHDKGASQFPLGTHRFHVGAYDATAATSNDQSSKEATTAVAISSFTDLSPEAVVKVDLDCLYYRDDDVDDFYAPLDKLQLTQPLELRVVDWTRPETSCDDDDDDECKIMDEPWVLDICLDYFYCINPFLADIELTDKEFARLLRSLVASSSFYHEPATTSVSATTPSVDRDGLLRYRAILKDVLVKLAASGETFTMEDAKRLSQELEPFIVDDNKERLCDTLIQLQTILAAAKDSDKRIKLREDAIESLGHVMLPHSGLSSKNGTAMKDLVGSAMEIFEKGLKQRLLENVQRPFLITMARSKQDGFTPDNLVDHLQNRVRHILQQCLCYKDCKHSDAEQTCTCLEFVHDY